MSDYDEYVATNNVERVYGHAPALVSGVGGKPDNGFRDLLKRIHKGSGLQSSINTW